MRDAFVRTLTEYAMRDKNIILVTGDLGFGVLKNYWETLPNQFVNAGIAEQNMTGVAAGMAIEGKTVITYSIGNFPTIRCLEQIRNDCAYHDANVKIVCVGGGFTYGSLGMSHHATEDISILRALPNIVVTAPGDFIEAEAVTKAILEYKGTCYLRLGRGGEYRIHEKIENYKLGKAIKIRDGEKIVLFSTGGILDEVSKAVNILNSRGISTALYTFPTIKPLDNEVVLECSNKYDYIITVEENNIIGGFGGAIAEVLSENPRKANLIRIGLNDTYSSIVGSQSYLRDRYGLTASKIAQRSMKYVSKLNTKTIVEKVLVFINE